MQRLRCAAPGRRPLLHHLRNDGGLTEGLVDKAQPFEFGHRGLAMGFGKTRLALLVLDGVVAVSALGGGIAVAAGLDRFLLSGCPGRRSTAT
jgi:hypothetical protein